MTWSDANNFPANTVAGDPQTQNQNQAQTQEQPGLEQPELELGLEPGHFSSRVLDWARQHGRHDLPWQQQPSPYRVWVSEIMLQQTQVTTVIPYFLRFTERFPDLPSLAEAAVDEVMHYWSGLGYYARARNLHKAAGQLVEQHDGVFPASLDALMELPGMGRSTAGAVLSLAMDQSQPILDGNVKRVLARHFAVEGWPGQAAVQKRLWSLSDALTPVTQCAAYNQAMMDLGSLVCTRGKPKCEDCPVSDTCLAKANQNQADYPGRKPRKVLPVRELILLAITDQRGRLLLQQRPPAGVWGGLWSLPELAVGPLEKVPAEVRQFLGLAVDILEELPMRRHTFSHFHLDILPLLCRAEDGAALSVKEHTLRWVDPDNVELGVSAAVSRLLKEINFITEPT